MISLEEMNSITKFMVFEEILGVINDNYKDYYITISNVRGVKRLDVRNFYLQNGVWKMGKGIRTTKVGIRKIFNLINE